LGLASGEFNVSDNEIVESGARCVGSEDRLRICVAAILLLLLGTCWDCVRIGLKMNEGERVPSLEALGFVCVRRLKTVSSISIRVRCYGLNLPNLIDIKLGCFSGLLTRSFYDISLLFLKDGISFA